MSIFGKFKQALGFSDTEEDYFDGAEDYQPVSTKKESIEKAKNVAPAATSDNVVDDRLPHEIFDGVVKLFNESLPDFLKSCVDVEAQRKYIYDSLDAGMKSYLEQVANQAKLKSDGKWKDERAKMQNELAQLKAQSKSMDEQRAEWQKQQLSAERQKRALSERLHDLEKQVATLEAEKEQYDLENKSLLNKLKVSAVVDGDMAEMRQEIADLQARLKEARETDKSDNMQALIDSANASIEEKNNEISELKEQLSKLATESKDDANATLVESLNAQIEELTSANNQLTEAVEQLKTKEAIADAMINELNAKASEAIHSLEEKEKQLMSVENTQTDVDAELVELKEKLSLANKELEASREELEEARASMAVIDDIQEQLTKFEDIKKKKDAKIADLQKDNKKYLSKITELENEAVSLKKTIENNLYQQVESEKKLRQEIDELKAKKTNAPIIDLDNDATVAEIKSNSSKKVKISAIDESLDDTDWLVATPPPGTVTRPTPATTDDDFGYQSPARKQTPPENDAQMSLF